MQNSDHRKEQNMLTHLRRGTELLASADPTDVMTGATYLWELSLNRECHKFIDVAVLKALSAALHTSYHHIVDGAGYDAATACVSAVWTICDQNTALGSQLIEQGVIPGLAQLTTLFESGHVTPEQQLLLDRLAGAVASMVDHHEGTVQHTPYTMHCTHYSFDGRSPCYTVCTLINHCYTVCALINPCYTVCALINPCYTVCALINPCYTVCTLINHCYTV
jgi:hypothetical protein